MGKKPKIICAGYVDCKMTGRRAGGTYGLCMHAIPHCWDKDCKPTKCFRTPKPAICEEIKSKGTEKEQVDNHANQTEIVNPNPTGDDNSGI